MQDHREHIIRLIEKAEQGKATPAEQAELDAFYDSFEHKPGYTDALGESDRTGYRERLFARIGQRLRPSQARRIHWAYWAAAAAVLLVASVVGYFAVDRQESPVDNLAATQILPGGNRATLALADGRTIALSEAQAGIVVADGITYLDGSAVLGHNPLTSTPQLLTLTTPKGGTYAVTLPDGSRVWLNSASTLKYPSRFENDERVVEIAGEGFFEIERDSKRPFKVRSERQEIEVLGTIFNVAAYADEEETRTTLVEGRVRVGSNHVLRPGEQAITRGGTTTIAQVDTESATAWKDGYFVFDNEPLHSILRKVGRWYDVEIQYQDDVQDLSFLGIIPRSERIQAVLTRLEKTGDVKFSIKGRRVDVMR